MEKNEKISMTKGSLRYASTNKMLTSKIKAKLTESIEDLYWYLKFNLKLDPDSVNNDTMYVTDLGGFIMDTLIVYNREKNIIKISPRDTYEKNFYYILNITTGVKSESGKNLKKQINILFKLLDSKIVNIEILGNESYVPEPKRRHKGYEATNVVTRVTSLPSGVTKKSKQYKLNYSPIRVNLVLPIVSLAILPITLRSDINNYLVGNLILILIGVITLIGQISKNDKSSCIKYNIGVLYFNFGRYRKAEKYFKKAIEKDEYNERAELALGKIKYYI